MHIPHLIQDLAFTLGVAALVTLVFRRLGQPVVLGYLLAGFLVSPHFPLVPTVVDVEGIKVWGEIGVIFLLFGLGLEFSFRKLLEVGRAASITAVTEILVMLGAGFGLGQAFGWSRMDSLFLGGILAISSTTIIVRAFGELGLKGRRFTSLVFGVLVVEDLLAILLLVILSSVGATQTLSGAALLEASLRLAFFLTLWFVVGIFVLPIFLRRARTLLTDETMLIVAVGLCFFMVVLATKVGFSPALGAFVMGSLLAETREREKIEHLILPVRDLFAAVFFVSVGMLIDPGTLGSSWWPILWITVVTIVGKFVGSAAGSLLAGSSLRHAVQAGLSLAQIGEFSFIIATLGVTLKVTSDALYPIAVAVSAITTFTTPYLIRLADPACALLERKLPAGVKGRLERYREWTASPSRGALFFSLLYESGVKLLFNSVLVVAIGLSGTRLLLPVLAERLPELPYLSAATGGLVLLLSAPFLWAIFAAASGAVADRALWRPGRRAVLLVFGLNLAAGLALLAFLVGRFFAGGTAVTLYVAAVLAYLLVARRFAEPVYRRLEERFLGNLHERERAAALPKLAPWDAELAEVRVTSEAPLAGASLVESALRERRGVTVAVIRRGRREIVAPGRDERLLPGDHLYLIGRKDAVEAARADLEAAPTEAPAAPRAFGLERVPVTADSPFLGSPIRDSGLREALGGLVVGIERGGQRILNPDSSVRLLERDLLWVVGDLERIARIVRG